MQDQTTDDTERIALSDVEADDRVRVAVHYLEDGRGRRFVRGTVIHVRDFAGAPEIIISPDDPDVRRVKVYGDHRPAVVELFADEGGIDSGRLGALHRLPPEDDATISTTTVDVERDTDRVTDPARPTGN